jgi:hypothetical protein
MKQTIMYVGIIALLLFVLALVGTGLFFTLTGAGAPRSQVSIVTETPGEKQGAQPNQEATTSLSDLPTRTEQNIKVTPTHIALDTPLPTTPHEAVVSEQAPGLENAETPTNLEHEITPSVSGTVAGPDILPTGLSQELGTPSHEATAIFSPHETTVASTPETGEPAKAASSTCGLKSPTNILYINVGEGSEYNSSSVIRLIHIDPAANTIKVIAPPCNLWLSTPSLVKDYTISAMPLCSILPLINRVSGNQDPSIALATALTNVINDNFGIKADFSFMTKSSTLHTVFESIGEFEYNSPVTQTIENVPLQQGINKIDPVAAVSLFKAGQTEGSTWDVVERQNEIIKGIYAKLLKEPASVEEIIKKADVSTDLNAEQTSSMICTLKNISPEKITFSEFLKEHNITNEDGFISISNKDSLIEEMKAFFH